MNVIFQQKGKNMSTDIKLIRLCRKTINLEIEEYTGGDDGEDSYFSTDYFDVLHCENKKIEDNLDSIMGIENGSQIKEDEIAVQSYALYCNEETIQKYQNCKCYGNPFEGTDKSRTFLSLIQVYITPEIIARLESDEQNLSNGFLENISDDLHRALETFAEECEDSMVYRIYKLLSTGDFAVVIRSGLANTSFKISTRLRRRFIEIQSNLINKQKDDQRIVLYKTYTLLTMANSVIETKPPKLADKENQFVIRCCYSNKYWSEQNQVEMTLKNKNYSDQGLYRLNGRYDFAVYLKEEEFEEIFPYIVNYKRLGYQDYTLDNFDIDSFSKDNQVDYLKYLMKKGYLSYINERYLLRHTDVITKGDRSILASVKKQPFVYQRNKDNINKVTEKYETVASGLFNMHTNRKNLFHYMNLLNKLIVLCNTINSLSDTRIYTSVLLEQLNVILDSLNEYISAIENEGDTQLVEYIETYLRESIGALDEYSQYIRNNNLQSLQTPNYNIESNTSMEKMLIAFSEFVYTFIQYYMDSNVAEKAQLKKAKKEFLPVVVPDLKRSTVSVEVQFPEWNIFKENSEDIRKYLMIITCPTLKELGNVPVMIASLFHEIAHQFRYESRKERNRTVWEYVMQDAFEIIAADIVKRFEVDTDVLDVEKKLTVFVRDGMKKAYEKICYKIDGISKIPLAYLQENIRNEMELFLKNWELNPDVTMQIKKFAQEISLYLDLTDETEINDLKKYESSYKNLIQNLDEEEGWEKEKDNLIKVTCELFKKSFVHILGVDNTKSIWKNDLDNLEEKLLSKQGKQQFEKKIAELEGNDRQKLQRILYAFLPFYSWINSQKFESFKNMVSNRKLNRRFSDIVYDELCDEWDNMKKQDEKFSNDYYKNPRLWEEAVRYLGIDYKYNRNRDSFYERLKMDMAHSRGDVVEHIYSDIASYREETADLFMCSMIGLKPIGYINVMARNIPIDSEVTDKYLDRIIRVMVILWCNPVENETFVVYQNYYKVCNNIFEEIIESVNALIKDTTSDNEWKIKNDSKDPKMGFVDSEVDVLIKQIEEFACFFKKIDWKEREREFKDDLLHIETMVEILYEMVKFGYSKINRLCNCVVLLKDYKKGADSMKMLDFNDGLASMSLIKEMREEIADMMNAPWKKYEKKTSNKNSKKGALNIKIIDFILGMYYENKIRNARREES